MRVHFIVSLMVEQLRPLLFVYFVPKVYTLDVIELFYECIEQEQSGW